MDFSYYQNNCKFNSRKSETRQGALAAALEDTERRKKQLSGMVTNKSWLDVGTGNGGVLAALSPFARKAVAVEPKTISREVLIEEGYEVYSTIEDIVYDEFEVVTLFHVFEHLTNPLEILQLIWNKMQPGGYVVIEVPHANDFLLSFLNLECFKDFTFWSEHIILHTRKTLEVFLDKVHFVDIVTKGYQRYPLANHLYWLGEQKPGGHNQWSVLRNRNIDSAYSELLSNLDMNDTLIAYARKPTKDKST